MRRRAGLRLEADQSGRFHLRNDRLGKGAVQLAQQGARFFPDGAEVRFRPFEACDPDHEELVQVRTDDADELQTL